MGGTYGDYAVSEYQLARAAACEIYKHIDINVETKKLLCAILYGVNSDENKNNPYRGRKY